MEVLLGLLVGIPLLVVAFGLAIVLLVGCFRLLLALFRGLWAWRRGISHTLLVAVSGGAAFVIVARISPSKEPAEIAGAAIFLAIVGYVALRLVFGGVRRGVVGFFEAWAGWQGKQKAWFGASVGLLALHLFHFGTKLSRQAERPQGPINETEAGFFFAVFGIAILWTSVVQIQRTGLKSWAELLREKKIVGLCALGLVSYAAATVVIRQGLLALWQRQGGMTVAIGIAATLFFCLVAACVIGVFLAGMALPLAVCSLATVVFSLTSEASGAWIS